MDVSLFIIYNQLGGGNEKKWNTLQHNGPLFPPEYKPHKIPILYGQNKIYLEPLAEEYATLYAKYLETEYIKSNVFRNNFWKDWKKILGKNHIIQSLEECNFSQIYDNILFEKNKKQSIMKEEKKQQKEIKNLQEEKYKYAIVDGKQQPIGNYNIEPPGIFLGRGCNPKLGKIKTRIYPEDVIINISKDAPIPIPPSNHKWKQVIHDKTVEWLASWKDTINNKMKYIWLASHSDLKTQHDIDKFNLARKLKKNIKKIREENNKNLISENNKIKQLATALYLIDNLALRVGNEKGEDETDTVGLTSLRIEHISLHNNKVKLDFLGKDSVRYLKEFDVDEQIYKNLEELIKNKNKYDNLFDIKSNDLNQYLGGFMKDLTAKVFRTFNASNLLNEELKKINNKYKNETDKTKIINILLDEFNKANAKVAILCNHQKDISKSFKSSMDAINKQIKDIKNKIKNAQSNSIEKYKQKLKLLQSKKNLKLELKNLSLGTSKVNYIDPRISISFLKKHNIPIDKIFSKTLQEKFKWAFDVEDFDF